MPRYIVERTFPSGLALRTDETGVNAVEKIVAGNAEHDVTWIHSYVNPERTSSYCVYDAPSPEAIRLAAETNCLPVDRITEVRVLNPYFYH
jgi:hypothetical protein